MGFHWEAAESAATAFLAPYACSGSLEALVEANCAPGLEHGAVELCGFPHGVNCEDKGTSSGLGDAAAEELEVSTHGVKRHLEAEVFGSPAVSLGSPLPEVETFGWVLKLEGCEKGESRACWAGETSTGCYHNTQEQQGDDRRQHKKKGIAIAKSDTQFCRYAGQREVKKTAHSILAITPL